MNLDRLTVRFDEDHGDRANLEVLLEPQEDGSILVSIKTWESGVGWDLTWSRPLRARYKDRS